MKPPADSVGARKLVSIAGWAKHAILYEFSSLKTAESNLSHPSDWTKRVIGDPIHAPHSHSRHMHLAPGPGRVI
jgi:hypothetical protein